MLSLAVVRFRNISVKNWKVCFYADFLSFVYGSHSLICVLYIKNSDGTGYCTSVYIQVELASPSGQFLPDSLRVFLVQVCCFPLIEFLRR
jgi:hypothetical protein